jgi:hypothetical protein
MAYRGAYRRLSFLWLLDGGRGFVHTCLIPAGRTLSADAGFLCIMHVMAWTWNASVSPHLDEPGAAEAVLSSADG